jgi:hypothetical protein
MNIYAAASLFAILILLYWIITEVFTVLFRLIGLPEEKARFQVVSLLTGTGYTTRESELMISTRPRRRLARITMLFGYVFNVTIVSAFVNIFVAMGETQVGHFVLSMLIPIFAVAAVFLVIRYHRVRLWIDRFIERIADRYGSDVTTNGVSVIDQMGSQTVARVTLHVVPEALWEKTLAEMDLRSAHNILLLLLEREDGTSEPPTPETKFRAGDRATVFGDYQEVCAVFQAKERFSER